MENTKQIMEQYQRENRDVIQRNKVKLVSTCFCSPLCFRKTTCLRLCRVLCLVVLSTLGWAPRLIYTPCFFLSLSLSSFTLSQTREQEELEELLLLEQQGNEQRRLETLQEEQRQLLAKRKNKQALLDELVREI